MTFLSCFNPAIWKILSEPPNTDPEPKICWQKRNTRDTFERCWFVKGFGKLRRNYELASDWANLRLVFFKRYELKAMFAKFWPTAEPVLPHLSVLQRVHLGFKSGFESRVCSWVLAPYLGAYQFSGKLLTFLSTTRFRAFRNVLHHWSDFLRKIYT